MLLVSVFLGNEERRELMCRMDPRTAIAGNIRQDMSKVSCFLAEFSCCIGGLVANDTYRTIRYLV
jgi:hypothetical protein